MRRIGVGMLIIAVVMVWCRAAVADTGRKTLELRLGGSELVRTSQPFRRVSVANPEIADVIALSPKELYVFGKKVGYTSMILWDEASGNTLVDVLVALDLTGLKEKIHLLYPMEKVEVYGSETGIVLTGTVSGPEIVEQLIRLAQIYLPSKETTETEEKGEGERKKGEQVSGRSGWGITNLLRVGGNQQVMLEVKFAEVSRTSNKNFQAGIGIGKIGSEITGAFGVGNVLSPLEIKHGSGMAVLPGGLIGDVVDVMTNALVQAPNSLLLNFAGSAPNIFVNIDNFTMTLEFLESEGLARTLAEPRLVTQSGQKASFLAGGEFPIPFAHDWEHTGIEFKEFGVSLMFTPVVMSDGRISLHVTPGVSEITSMTEIMGYNLPNLATRKLDTTVELYDGQTLALAGLLQDNIRENVSKIPGLAEIPVLGALFRSSSYIQQKTDLLVAVTPHLVKPVNEGAITFPGEHMEPPSQVEFYLEGRLEGRRGAGVPSSMSSHGLSPPPAAEETRGLQGDFGYQPMGTTK